MAGPKTRVSLRTGCAIIARSTAPAMVSCERPSPKPCDDARQTVREFLDRYPKPAQHNFLMPSCTGS
jgi:hypothetical protein